MLKIYTFGRFQVFYGEQQLTTEHERSKKIWELLMYLITHRDKIIPSEIIAGAVWPEQDYENPAGAVKNLVHRLRKKIDGDKEGETASAILNSHGCYGWNKNYQCRLDTEAFELHCRQAQALINADQTLACEMYSQALSYYQGEYLPEQQYRDWVHPVRLFYKNLFIRSMNEYLELLKEQRFFPRILEICEKAILIESYEEDIHLHYLEALIEEGKTPQALKHYEYVSTLFYQAFETKPSSAMKRLYSKIKQRSNTPETGYFNIRELLQEREKVDGPMYCDLDYFKFLCNMEMRRAEREEHPIHIGLLTLDGQDYRLPSSLQIEESAEHLKKVLSDILRKGDIFTFWNEGQVAMLLPGATREQSEMILERSVESFAMQNVQEDLVLRSSVHPILPLEKL